jgi:hypothetical protein
MVGHRMGERKNMELELVYDSQESIPEGFDALYTEKDGKWSLTGVKGLKTNDDVRRLQSSLEKERKDHKVTKTKLEKFKSIEDMNIDELQEQLARIPELEAAAEGKIDKTKMDQLVEQRVNAKLQPVEREKAEIQKKLDDALKSNDELSGSLVKRDINDEVRKAAVDAKITSSAVDDVLLLAGTVFERDESGAILAKETGLSAKDWIASLKETRPHWWPQAEGAGARGGGGPIGDNPWSAKNWDVTKQGAVVREKGLDYAKKLAANAGSEVGAVRPPAK